MLPHLDFAERSIDETSDSKPTGLSNPRGPARVTGMERQHSVGHRGSDQSDQRTGTRLPPPFPCGRRVTRLGGVDHIETDHPADAYRAAIGGSRYAPNEMAAVPTPIA